MSGGDFVVQFPRNDWLDRCTTTSPAFVVRTTGIDSKDAPSTLQASAPYQARTGCWSVTVLLPWPATLRSRIMLRSNSANAPSSHLACVTHAD